MKKIFTTEQLIKIIGEGSYELGLHDGRCEVLERLREGAKSCNDEEVPWSIIDDEVEKWAIEVFNIDIRKKDAK